MEDKKRIVFTRKPPGSRVYTGRSLLDTTIHHYQYKDQLLIQKENIYEFSNEFVDWITVEGFKDTSLVKEVCKEFSIHPLTVDDILSVTQRNKVEIKEDNLFLMLKYITKNESKIEYQYISIILNEHNIVTFTDYINPFTEVLHTSIQDRFALISTYKEDYLLYAIYDMIVDEQISLLDSLSLELQEYESIVLEADSNFGAKVYRLHKELVLLRNNVKSLKTNVAPLSLLENRFVSEDMKIFLDDLEDHINNLLEKSNNSIEVCNSLIALYSNELSNRTNNIMKTLTIISVIFIPLSFIAGVFGMNFEYVPLLASEYGFILFVVFSVLLVSSMLYYFKRKDWL